MGDIRLAAPVKVFFCEPTGRDKRYLRRYTSSERCAGMGGDYSYHNASTFLDEAPTGDGRGEWCPSDPRWPAKCENCDYRFTEADAKLLFTREIYRRVDTGALETWEYMPFGAVRHCAYLLEYRDHWRGDDGRILEVKIPANYASGQTCWIIDSQCSNCTKKEDQTHRCWVRHGRPEDGTLHVDKKGNTCSAGAGSIQVPGFHGYLHNGHITNA